jgi:peptidoglycan/xylan/chitin deacetylase (PgdA/CDA1 family)
MVRHRFLPVSLPLLALFLVAVWFVGPSTGAEPVTIWAGRPSQRAVALTFDDGPSPTFTKEILDLLRRYQAKATFFVLGEKVEKYPGLIKTMVRDGHEVGNHTFDHDRLTKLPQPAWARECKELERTQMDLKILGCPCERQLMRPPYSDFDDRLISYARHTGRKIVLWGVDSGDWRGLDAQTIAQNVLARVKNGSIVVLHDSDEEDQKDRRPTVEALEIILPVLKAQGYRLVTVPELVGQKQR